MDGLPLEEVDVLKGGHRIQGGTRVNGSLPVEYLNTSHDVYRIGDADLQNATMTQPQLQVLECLQRFGNVLKEAGVPVVVFGAKETTHNKVNADIGLVDDAATKALYVFLCCSRTIVGSIQTS